MSTQKEVAEHLDLSDRQVRYHLTGGVLPPSKGHGGYDLDACRVAYIRHLRGVASGQRSEDSEALDPIAERARKDAAQANRTEFDLSVLKKEYIHVSHLERMLERFASAAAAKFDSIGARLHQQYPDLKARHIDGIKAEIADARNYVAGLQPDTD
jgi:phage terminase Nu1 subunit (DNA packaging protein)